MTGRVEALTTGRALAADGDCTIWALTDAGGTWQLWRGDPGQPGPFQQATLDDLAAAVDRTSLTAATDQGFCLTEPGPDGDPVTRCFSWDGRAARPHRHPGRPPLQTTGQLLTRADRQRPATLPLAPGPRRRRRAARDQRDRGRRHQRGTHPVRLPVAGPPAARTPGRPAEPGRLAGRPARRRPTSSWTSPPAGTCTCGCG